MNKILIIIGVIVLTFTGRLFSQEMLDQYVLTAAENNPTLKAKFNDYLASLEKIPQVRALPDPSLAFAYFIQPVETRLGPQHAKISASQMFPWFGTLKSREGSAEALAKVRYEEFKNARSEIIYDVKTTYYNLYFLNKAIMINRKNIDILKSFREMASIRIESGNTSALDLYRVDMEMNDLENELALLQDQLYSLKVKFNNLLNVDETVEVSVSDTLHMNTLPSKQSLLDSINRNNHALSAINHQLNSLEFRKETAQKEGMPAFTLGLEYTFIGTGDGLSADAGRDAFVFPKVGITVPLYREKYKARIREVLFLEEARINQILDKENSLSTLFEDAWKDFQDADRRITLYKSQYSLAKKSIILMETAYATGKLQFEEILRMERKLLKYELETQKAHTDREAAVAFIFYLKGNN